MKKKVDGVWIDETPEDEAAIIESLKNLNTDVSDTDPTPESQIAELKAQLAALETILLGGETNG